MELVLWFLDADELRRVRVIEHRKVGKQLKSSIGGELGKNGTVERGVLNLQEQAPVGHQVRCDILQLWNAVLEDAQNHIELILVLFAEVLDHIRQVIAALRETFLRSGFWSAPGVISSQIGQVPAGDEAAQCTDARVLGKLAQGIDRKQIWRVEFLVNTFGIFIRLLTRDDNAFTPFEVKEMK